MDANLNLGKNLPPLLRECWNKLNSTFMKRVKHLGITPDQYITLRCLHEYKKGYITQSMLADLMFTDRNNISGIMKRMEALNLIDRKINIYDKRQKIIFATSKGKSLFIEGKKIANQLEREALSLLSKSEKEHFLVLLNHLSKSINVENNTVN